MSRQEIVHDGSDGKENHVIIRKMYQEIVHNGSDGKENHVMISISSRLGDTDRNENENESENDDSEARKKQKQKAPVIESFAGSSSNKTRSSDGDNNSETGGKQDSAGNKSSDQTDFDTAGYHREFDEYNWWSGKLLRNLLQKNWYGIRDCMRADYLSIDSGALTARMELFKQNVFVFLLTQNLDVPDDLMKKLSVMIQPELLRELKDESGRSPLFWAAMYGNKKAAEALVNKCHDLLNIKDRDGSLPVHVAASCGHKDVTMYLLRQTGIHRSDKRDEMLEDERTFKMLEDLVESGLYGIALALLKNIPLLALEGEVGGRVLTSLARTPHAFRSGSRLTYWERFIYHWIPVREEVLSFIPDIQREDFDLEDDGSELKDDGSDLDGLTLLRRLSHTARGLCHKLYLKLRSILMLPGRSIKPIHDAKLTHMQTLEIVRKMCPNVAWRTKRAEQALSKPFLTAARFGIYELVEEILKHDFNSFTFIDNETGHDILQISIIYRQEEVFGLLNKMNLCLWPWKAANPRAESNMERKKSENLLHLAGGLVPSTKVSGAALQMQRELQWFKAVESYVHPSLRGQRNESGQTPREVFTKNHESLVKEGEKWMKETAKSCTIVAALIITVAFAAAFTVPGGNDTRGIPNFLHKPSFIVFTISDALALFASTASVLIFLGILTSRYSEEDFLESLPKKLIFGHITLFLSIASMMVAFGAAVYMLLSDLWPPVFIPIAILGGLTVIIFARLQFPLLIELYLSTYRSGIYQGTK